MSAPEAMDASSADPAPMTEKSRGRGRHGPRGGRGRGRSGYQNTGNRGGSQARDARATKRRFETNARKDSTLSEQLNQDLKLGWYANAILTVSQTQDSVPVSFVGYGVIFERWTAYWRQVGHTQISRYFGNVDNRASLLAAFMQSCDVKLQVAAQNATLRSFLFDYHPIERAALDQMVRAYNRCPRILNDLLGQVGPITVDSQPIVPIPADGQELANYSRAVTMSFFTCRLFINDWPEEGRERQGFDGRMMVLVERFYSEFGFEHLPPEDDDEPPARRRRAPGAAPPPPAVNPALRPNAFTRAFFGRPFPDYEAFESLAECDVIFEQRYRSECSILNLAAVQGSLGQLVRVSFWPNLDVTGFSAISIPHNPSCLALASLIGFDEPGTMTRRSFYQVDEDSHKERTHAEYQALVQLLIRPLSTS